MKTLLKVPVVLIVVLLFSLPVSASEWKFYGSARVGTFMKKTDVLSGPDTNNLHHSLQGNSRIGARIKVSDVLSARFEYGTGVDLRVLYGNWKFGKGQLLVGQYYSPLNLYYSSQVVDNDNNLLNYGSVYSGRNPMVRLRFGDFRIAFLEPGTSTLNGNANSTTQVRLPKVEARYDINLDKVRVNIAGGVNTYEITDGATGIAHDVNSYVLALAGRVKFGPAYLAGSIWTGQNVGPYGLFNASADDPEITGNALADNNAFGFHLVAGTKINDMFSVEAGYGHTEADLDLAGTSKDDARSCYIQSRITLSPGVFVVPEIGLKDGLQESDSTQDTDTFYYGMKCQINF